jgi:glutamyl-Q tRNA(Asp) synthetase
VNDAPICFDDRLRGRHCQYLETDIGDFVVKRADGFFAYQLAVVVDDAEQGITHVVRGADLLASTQRQIYLQKLLGYPTPDYLHLPVVLNEAGQKLSKQTLAPPLTNHEMSPTLCAAMTHLGLTPAPRLNSAPPQEVLTWGAEEWGGGKLAATLQPKRVT